MIKILSQVILLILLASCASKPGPAPQEEIVPAIPVAEKGPEADPMLKYSNNNNMAPPSDRDYRRMTRLKMEEEAQLQASAGSLWVMEGQSSFLFSKNKHRTEGDPTSIKVEGVAMKLIESKVAVIQDLMKDLEEQRIQAEAELKKQNEEKERLAAQERLAKEEALAKNTPQYDPYAGQYPADLAAEEAKRKPAAVTDKKTETAKSAKEPAVDLKEVALIPSRIVERTNDGMYRIRGQQFITIKKKPYKVIATGLVRIEDFDDTDISSNKLRDAQFDVIHMKRTD